MTPKPTSRWTSYSRALLFLLAILVLGELAAKLAIVKVLGIKSRSYYDYYQNDPDRHLLTWMDVYEPHPYFGFVNPGPHQRAVTTLNARTGNDYVIGIFGGSVAQRFGDFLLNRPDYQARFRDAIPAVGDRNIRIVNLAEGGYKQPQQFVVASFFLDKVDCLLTVDGFNDLTAQDFSPLYPMEYPVLSLRFYEHRSGPAAWRGLGNTLKWLYTRMDAVPLAIPGLSRSNLYFLFWRAVHPGLLGSIRYVQSRFYASAVGRELTREEAAASSQQKLAMWKKFTLLQSRLAEAVGKPALFFVQPNQYLRQSKPLSEEERLHAFNPAFADLRDLGMRLVRDAVPDLRQSGTHIYDMTQTFVGTTETLYQDDCCHFNARGNQILADAVLAILAQQPRDQWAPRPVRRPGNPSPPGARP